MIYSHIQQNIALVDENDNVLGKADKWETHKEGKLHRAFTLMLMYENQAILQHRKHKVFDDVFDITLSSHPLFQGEHIEDDDTAIIKTLKRETNLTESDLASDIEHVGTIQYQADDPNSEYKENEICRIYKVKIKQLPKMNNEFAYGMSIKSVEDIKKKQGPTYSVLAPWVKEMIAHGLI